MLDKLILTIFVSKPQAELDEDYLKHKAIICIVAGVIVIAISFPALQYVHSQIASGVLIEKIPGAVNPIGITIIVCGFYLLMRGLAHLYLLKTFDD